MPTRPTLGAWPEADGFRFRVWAPAYTSVELVIEQDSFRDHIALQRDDDGTWSCGVKGVGPGARYGYVLDGDGPFPDPASRWQPDGVHALSALVDPTAFAWTNREWRGVPLRDAVIYELHVGTFSPEGTFDGARRRLPHLADLGVTVIELMPIGDFPGARNWGYDEVSLFAPTHVYGTPDDLRCLVDAAHALGLAVILDVVYNHFGPDGAYGFRFSPAYASTSHTSPWGAALNFDGDQSAHVRTFVLENALHWIREYQFDGLRLDATHAIVDTGPEHIMAELTRRVRAEAPDRTVLLIAEDDRNLNTIVEPVSRGGWGMDAVWADDFHHIARRAATGDREGYFADFSGDARDLATTIERGWFYAGQSSIFRHAPRGTSAADIPRERMVICLQNHDQIGNRPFGDRLNQSIEPSLYRALTTVLLMAPETPLLFMGQEWAASTPFQYFTDHNAELGRQVTDGRRAEFASFSAFRDPAVRDQIPDPQASSTFEHSRLNWDEIATPAHAAMLRFYRRLLHVRREVSALEGGDRHDCRAAAPDADVVTVVRTAADGEALFVVARIRGAGAVPIEAPPNGRAWSVALTSQDEPFRSADESETPMPVLQPGGCAVSLPGPSAIVLRAT